MKTKSIRKILCAALQKAERGELQAEEAKAIIGMANQIANSLATEVKVASMKMRLGGQADTIGELDVA